MYNYVCLCAIKLILKSMTLFSLIQAVKDSLLAVSGVTVNGTVIRFPSPATRPDSSRVQSSNIEELSRAVYIGCVNPTLRSKCRKDSLNITTCHST